MKPSRECLTSVYASGIVHEFQGENLYAVSATQKVTSCSLSTRGTILSWNCSS